MDNLTHTHLKTFVPEIKRRLYFFKQQVWSTKLLYKPHEFKVFTIDLPVLCRRKKNLLKLPLKNFNFTVCDILCNHFATLKCLMRNLGTNTMVRRRAL